MKPEEFWSVQMIATEAGVCEDTVRRWAKQAKIELKRGANGNAFTREQKKAILSQRCEHWRGGK